MSLVSRLVELFAPVHRPAPGRDEAAPPDERLAGLALLVHVAAVDGRLAPAERARLGGLLQAQLGVEPDAAEAAIAEAERLDRATGDVAALVDMIGPEAPEAERRRLIAMAYAVASADGVVGEFEEDLVWRVGHLLGLDEAALQAIRAEQVPVTKP